MRYEVMQQTRFGGMDNAIEARIVCAADDLNSLRSWQVLTYSRSPSGDKVPLSEMNETGENRVGQIQAKGGKHQYGFAASHPVVSQWTVLDFLIRRATENTSVTFDLLQDLSLFKANQTLVFDGNVEVTVKGGRRVELDSFAQTGEGILPVHYMLDGQGRPQLVTGSLVSWALRSVTLG